MGLGFLMIILTGLIALGITVPMAVIGVKTLFMDRRAADESGRLALWKRILAAVAILLGLCGTGAVLWLLFTLSKSVLGYTLLW